MTTPDDIRGEVALITGASRGLGLLLARELAGHSCPLVICARDSAGLERAAGRLRAAGRPADRRGGSPVSARDHPDPGQVV